MLRVKQCFFDATDEHKPPLRLNQVVLTSSEIALLYRGFPDIPKTMFSLSTIALSLWGHRLTSTIGMEEIRLHKLSNLQNDAHMFSMTVDTDIAKRWGKDNFITIDPSICRDYIIDVSKTYARHTLCYPARYALEREHVSLAVLYCSIKSITIGGKEIDNPFYLKISPDNQAALKAFKTLYLDYLDLLMTLKDFSVDEAHERVRLFLDSYLGLYEAYALDNPMEKSLATLESNHPDYIDMLKKESEIDMGLNMKALLKKNIKFVLSDHPYSKGLLDKKPFDAATVLTCDEDPYSYGCGYE